MTLVEEPSECSICDGLRRFLLIVLWLLPMLGIAALVWRYAVDAPFMDDFGTAISLNRYASAGLLWSDLIVQANESRIVFPRLLFLALAQLTHWDPRYQMAASVALLEITAGVLLLIARRTIRNTKVAFTIAMLVNLLLFSPVQWQNFLFGIQFCYFVPTFALAVILQILGSRLNVWFATAIAVLAAMIGTYSYANGMVLWVLAIPLFFAHPSPRNFRALSIWLILAAISLGYYFHGYTKPPQTPSMLIALRHPVEALWFFLGFLGNGMRPEMNLKWAVCLGAGASFTWGVGCLYVFLIAWNRRLLQRALPWMMLGAYSIASAIPTTLGRFGFGLIMGMEARYTTFALPLWISIVPIWVVILQHLVEHNSLRPAMARCIITVFFAAILGFSLNGDLFIRQEVLAFTNLRLAGRAAVQFSDVVPEDQAIRASVFPDPPAARGWIKLLDQNDLLRVGLFRTNDISPLAVRDNTAFVGSFDRFVLVGHSFELGGWSSLPIEKRRSDAVLLTTPDAKGVERVIAVVEDYVPRPRPDVVAVLQCPSLLGTGWIEGIDQSRLPRGAIITAWAYDSFERKAYRLMNPRRVPG